MGDPDFEFDSGHLALDFANTKDWHASQTPQEKLNSYADLVAWGQQAGLVSTEAAARLRLFALEQPRDSLNTYQFAIQLREALYHIFSNQYANLPLAPSDLATLNSVVQQAMAHLRLTPVNGVMQWEWDTSLESANLILWPVARAAAELLTSPRASLVRECEDDRGCGFLFMDQSKNHSRRWCSMESCGNRAKARRHYAKTQSSE